MINEIRASHRNVLVVDCGDTFDAAKNVPKLRAETVLKGMDQMGYDALNLGERELSLGIDFLAAVIKDLKFPIISANIATGKKEYSSVIRPYVIKKIGSVRVGITGGLPEVLLTPNSQKEGDIQAKNTVDALKAILPDMKKQSDIIIFMSHFGDDGTQNLLLHHQISGIDIVIAGHGRNMIETPKVVGGAILLQNSMGGEYLGKLVLKLGKNHGIAEWHNEIIALTDKVPEDKALAEIETVFESDKKKEEERIDTEKKEKEALEKEAGLLKMNPQDFFEMMKKQNQTQGVEKARPPLLPVEK